MRRGRSEIGCDTFLEHIHSDEQSSQFTFELGRFAQEGSTEILPIGPSSVDVCQIIENLT